MKQKRRSDYGRVVLTERDVRSLVWMGEQFAIRFDHLQILAGRLSENPEALPAQGLSYQATYRISTRWVKAGLAVRKKILVGEPMWLWLTRRGIEQVGLELPYHQPAISRLAHIHAVNAVRLLVEARLGDRVRWIGERAANMQRMAAGKTHLVDGELRYQTGEVVAVEVELTQKRRVRLRRILEELRQDYYTVWYFVAPECRTAVEHAIQQLEGHEKTFVVYPLPL